MKVFFCAGAGATLWAWTGAGAAPAGAVNVLPWGAGGVGTVASGGGSSGPLRPHPVSGSEQASAKTSARAARTSARATLN
jgi:hypothetical protein